MPLQENIEEQLKLLRTHRETLDILLEQEAQHTKPYTPPATVHGIRNARAKILRIKLVLRSWGEEVEDLPGDIEEGSAILSPEQNDANLLKEHRVIFQRRAFSTPCFQELSLSDLIDAIDASVAALNTGHLHSRQGNAVGKFPNVNSYITQEYRDVFRNILDDLFYLQRLAMEIKPVFHQHSSDKSIDYFEFLIQRPSVNENTEIIIDLVKRMDEIDKVRNEILVRINNLLQNIGENPFQLMDLSSDVVKKRRKYNLLYDKIADLL